MKFLRNLFLLVALLVGGQRAASAQVVEWANLAQPRRGSNAGMCQASCTDRSGNTFAFLAFSDSAYIGGRVVRRGSATGNISSNALIKYDSLGRVAWVKVLGNVRISYRSIVPDPSGGGVFFAAYAYGSPTWDGAPLPSGGTRNFFAKCTAAGALAWASSVPGDSNTAASLAADGQGSLYLISSTSINRPLTNAVGFINGVRVDTTSAFVLKANPAGVVQWVHLLKGTPLPYSSLPYAVRAPSGLYDWGLVGRPGGGCLLRGIYGDSLQFDNATIASTRSGAGSKDNFVARLTAAGTVAWVRPGDEGNGTDPVPDNQDQTGLATDRAGNYYLTGRSFLGLSVAKYTDAGALVWARNQRPTAAPTGATGTQVSVDDAGAVTILAVTRNLPSDPLTVVGSYALRSIFSIIRYDAAGQLTWATDNGLVTQPALPDAFSYNQVSLGVDGPGNVYLASEVYSYRSNIPGRPVLPVVRLGDFTLVGGGVAVARIGTRHNTVRGRLYLDANGNGVREANEGAFPQNMVLQGVQPTYQGLGTMEPDGNFNVYLGTGAYTLAPPVPPLHYALTQPGSSGYSGSFVGYGRVDTARHFGFRPIPNQVDLRATLTPYTAARPGFQARQRLTLDNVGTSTIPAGTATLTLDANTAFVSSYPTATATGRVVRWNYPAIPPFGRRSLDVTTSLPATVPIGTALQSAADAPVPGDVVPADNSSSASQTVTGSYDPNDISVNYERLSPAQVAARLPLDYTIRFQNMGTDTAFTVVITDTLDFRKLDLTTLELVAESHRCTWSLSGRGTLTLRFLNIGLPHRSRNELGSQGFVRFRVRPRASLVLGDLVQNKADIFFDFNAPVRTNTATTAVLLPTALAAEARATAFAAYPNPARESVSISAELTSGGTVRVALLDALGRTVRQLRVAAAAGPLRHTLSVIGLAPGVYVLRLALPDGSASSQRLVVE